MLAVLAVGALVTAVFGTIAWFTADALDQLWLLIWFPTIGFVAIGGGIFGFVLWEVDRSSKAVRDAERGERQTTSPER